MTTATRQPARRAIGIIRVSETKGRKGESFASPAEQRERIKDACKRDKLRLVKIIEELDASGGTRRSTPQQSQLGSRSRQRCPRAARPSGRMSRGTSMRRSPRLAFKGGFSAFCLWLVPWGTR